MIYHNIEYLCEQLHMDALQWKIDTYKQGAVNKLLQLTVILF